MTRKVCFGTFLIGVFVSAGASSADFPMATSWVNDYAGILTGAQKKELDETLKQFEDATTSQVVVLKKIPRGNTGF